MVDQINDVLLACTVGNLYWLKRGLKNGDDLCSTDGEVKHALDRRVVQ